MFSASPLTAFHLFIFSCSSLQTRTMTFHRSVASALSSTKRAGVATQLNAASTRVTTAVKRGRWRAADDFPQTNQSAGQMLLSIA
ncbi:hypothetical protein BDZ90DRAFT_40353 [Jaminaea rosea]|uniref:Secreted protein n=1 Tax=Jaminaea rosea TaxID=1569628 RepID=A0A316UMM5_9BASI|nr:hypothetical protein BDZ90DRAFT_40353 [Jaminaea rosea]PWN26509.1 hypothetical protein BDZ90DRAFT_40353 [Jaminaea rosea]